MFITTINKLCQKHSRAAFLVIGILIIVPFVFLWGNSSSFSSAGGWFSSGANVGTMYGNKVNIMELRDLLSAEQFSMQLGTQHGYLDLARGRNQEEAEVAAALWRLRVLTAAGRLGLDKVGDTELGAEIQKMPMFRDKKGSFDRALFERFILNLGRGGDDLTRSMNADRFYAIVRENMVIRRMEEKAMDGVFIAPAEVREIFGRFYGRHETAVLNFTASDEIAAAKALATDEQAKAWYIQSVEPFRAKLVNGVTPEDLQLEIRRRLANTALPDAERAQLQGELRQIQDALLSYYIPGQTRLKLALFPVKSYEDKTRISEEKIAADYERNQAVYQRAEARVQQLVLSLAAGATAAEKAGLRREADSLRQKASGGANFSQMVEKDSDDFRSRGKDGDIGFVFAGRPDVDKDVAAAALALKSAGEISPVVESETGFTILRLTERRGPRSLDQVKDEIRRTLTAARAESLAAEAAKKFSGQIDEAVANGMPLDQALERFVTLAATGNIALQESDWFAAGDPVPPFLDEAGLKAQASRMNTRNPQSTLSDIIKGRGIYYIAIVSGERPGRLPVADEPTLLAKVKEFLVKENSLRLAREKAQNTYAELRKKMDGGATFTAAKGALRFTDIKTFNLAEAVMDREISPIASAVAEIQPGKLAPAQSTADGAMLVYLKNSRPPEEKDFADKKKRLEGMLYQQKGEQAVRDFYLRLQKESDTRMQENVRLPR